ncbi:uncharacterized protein B0P05DRAFT_579513 [Gilbertella persicaria]|uniref:Transducer of ERBB2 n=1 Tax=Rhizopus stolonifer TaxID=4846 RepID=A0A367KRQ4_RHIST|nr:uncharacterized protein B0P05DRAFT_579513 [Gilbertella persicaria]KAI8078273.1 hypothetical protein B0P05DRAFT_579513 [Gilbertella persicaria]RCI04884.1 transducer of ERBB2 [Rhizopus stolonifer]
MHIEIAQAVEFLGRLLQSKVDEDTIQVFKEKLVELLKQRFTDHWDSQQPYRGNGYRAISNFNGELDPIIVKACNKAQCATSLIHSNLPRDFVLWIDPFSVSYRVGDHGNIMTLYEDRSRGRVSMKVDASPRLQYLQPQSIPVRISPPNSPENKKMTSKPHLHQPSPLAVNAKKDEKIVMAN